MAKGISSVEAQVLKVFRHTRMGSFGTRARYRDSCMVFARYVAQEFKLQNIRNVSDKHLVSWIQERQSQDIAAKTIKNDLCALRYLHDHVDRPRYNLSSNEELKEKHGLELDPTPVSKGNRAWTEEEYKTMHQIAKESGRQDMADAMVLCRSMGLRITEAVAASRPQAEAALRTGTYEVRGEAKNGKWRLVPLSTEAKEVFERRLKQTERGGRLFINVDQEKTHEVVNRIEKWLYNNRDRMTTDEGRELRTWEKDGEEHINELTFHGLRYMYIQDRVNQEMDKGFSREQAAAIVSPEFGHNRVDVINIYMAGS